MIDILRRNNFIRRCWHAVRAAKVAAHDAWRKYVPFKGRPYELRGEYEFRDRRKKSDCVLLVLAGYKSQLWEKVFGRIERFAPANLDVCVITSGLKNEKIDSLCARRKWSYLMTERNSLTLAQNIAIELHPDAKWIYKIDEDVFLTEGFFEKLRSAYEIATKECRCGVGMVAPLLNVNGYCYVRILERLGMVKEWEKKFGALYYTEGFYSHRDILTNPDAAIFMWQLGQIDELNSKFSARPVTYSVSPYRFSIGAILFTREVWRDMGMFSVSTDGFGLGDDEEQLCIYCLLHTKAKVICENAYVGHLAFGPQTKRMLEYYERNGDAFGISA